MQQAAIVRDATAMFRQGLLDLFADVGLGELCPEQFAGLIRGLKAVSSQALLAAFIPWVESCDDTEVLLHRGGKRYRFKEATKKAWLTPFGLAEVTRRYYQQDTGGQGVIPVDEACGMVDHYCTPDVEQMVAFSAALMVPREVETLLGMALPHGPSTTAIGRVVRDMGRFVGSPAHSRRHYAAPCLRSMPQQQSLIMAMNPATVANPKAL